MCVLGIIQVFWESSKTSQPLNHLIVPRNIPDIQMLSVKFYILADIYNDRKLLGNFSVKFYFHSKDNKMFNTNQKSQSKSKYAYSQENDHVIKY